MQTPRIIQEMAQDAQEKGWRLLVVGGFVRDSLLGLESKDIDCEVYRVPDVDTLIAWLSDYGDVNAVGASFGVLKLSADAVDLDVSLPRRENKEGQGHRGFIVSPDPTMTPKEASARRDFTINAMAYDPLTKEVLDFFGGQMDLEYRNLRHTSEAFREDPLRVLRGFQFCGRFGLTQIDSTVDVCHSLASEYQDLATERVWIEWEKWAEKSVVPSYGLSFLDECTWIRLYPELYNLIECEQDEAHHPEGDAWNHTLCSVDAMADICVREGIVGEDKVVLMFAALLHDVGKPSTTRFGAKDDTDMLWLHSDGGIESQEAGRVFIRPGDEAYETWRSFVDRQGRIRAYGHDQAGEAVAISFLESLGAPKAIIERVVPLVKHHMRHVNYHTGGKVCAKHARRLARDLDRATVQEWAYVVESDHSGRPPLSGGLPQAARDLLRIAAEVAVKDSAPKSPLLGRHLIEMGMSPSRQFGTILKSASEAFIEGVFSDVSGGKAWVEQFLKGFESWEQMEK